MKKYLRYEGEFVCFFFSCTRRQVLIPNKRDLNDLKNMKHTC